MTDEKTEAHRPGLQPPRFGLSALMGGITLLAVFFALVNYLGSHATALLVFFALAVIAHVAGNALGTRLRDNGSTPVDDHNDVTRASAGRKTKQSEFAQPTHLRHKSALSPVILIVTGMGVVGGGMLGGFGFAWLSDQPANLTGIAFGAAAAAVLGGIWSFISASFLQVAGNAAWQASRDRQ